MVGVLVSFGAFTFLDRADLDWQKEMELSCPVNKVGRVSLYQTSRHGSFDGAGAPAFSRRHQPSGHRGEQRSPQGSGPIRRPHKAAGDVPASRPLLTKKFVPENGEAAGLEGIWQGHLSLLDKDPSHNTSPDMIANFEETAECQGNWIQRVGGAGRQVHAHQRPHGFSKTYMTRQAK